MKLIIITLVISGFFYGFSCVMQLIGLVVFKKHDFSKYGLLSLYIMIVLLIGVIINELMNGGLQ